MTGTGGRRTIFLHKDVRSQSGEECRWSVQASLPFSLRGEEKQEMREKKNRGEKGEEMDRMGDEREREEE